MSLPYCQWWACRMPHVAASLLHFKCAAVVDNLNFRDIFSNCLAIFGATLATFVRLFSPQTRDVDVFSRSRATRNLRRRQVSLKRQETRRGVATQQKVLPGRNLVAYLLSLIYCNIW